MNLYLVIDGTIIDGKNVGRRFGVEVAMGKIRIYVVTQSSPQIMKLKFPLSIK